MVGVKVRDEIGSEGGLGSNGSSWVGVTEQVGVDPGVFPLGGRSVVLVREPSFAPTVDVVLFALSERSACGGGFGDGVEDAVN